jgi:short subunit dehydrogenase-like uncharacterized protein
MTTWMIYGATGYTGVLLAEEAVRRGHRPLLAGRNAANLGPLAARLGLEYRAIPLEDLAALRDAVGSAALILHAAGPYFHSNRPMLEACLATGTPYLDINGEVSELEQAFQVAEQARERGIAVIPGVGFSVAASDCLAAYVAARVPDATTLTIAIHTGATASPGTVKGTLETIAQSETGCVRRGGVLEPHPYGQGARVFRFPGGARLAAPIPWGDLVTAYYTTGIPNITTYMAYPPRLIRLMGGLRLLSGALKFAPLRRAALGWAGRTVIGPDALLRRTARSEVFVRAENAAGDAAEGWLETVEAYRFTAEAGIRAVEQALARRPRGVLSPAQAFGVDFALSVPETVRLDGLEQESNSG